jgi:hypothetical protein
MISLINYRGGVSMNARTFSLRGLTLPCCLALLAACGSSEPRPIGVLPDAGPLGDVDGSVVREDVVQLGSPDIQVAPDDVPLVMVAGPPVGVDGPPADRDGPAVGLDGPAVDGRPVDGPNVDGSQTDAWLVSLPDGRVLRVVDYCGPILPLPAEGTESCPATFDEAMTQAATRQDASIPWYAARAWACSEGHYMYAPYGFGTACHYDPVTKQLVAITIADDTLRPCNLSDTASFVYYVYGQWVTCTGGKAIPIVDAGTVDGGSVDGGSVDGGSGQ